jgi:hypothetical protein
MEIKNKIAEYINHKTKVNNATMNTAGKLEVNPILKKGNCMNLQKTKTNNPPVIHSITGFIQEIFFLHPLHFPPKKIKLNKGINSCHFNGFLQ